MIKALLGILLLAPFNLVGQLLINEFGSKGGLEDIDKSCDWIELYNAGPTMVQLENYFLSDSVEELDEWQLPAEELSPDQWVVLAASGENLNEYAGNWRSLVIAEETWEYFLGAEEPDENWNSLGFDSSSWLEGVGGFGYGDADDATEIGGVTAVYMRQEFYVEDTDEVLEVVLNADFDDAYVAYLNGVEIARSSNIYGENPPFDAVISADHEAALYQGEYPEEVYLSEELINELLLTGQNVLAIQLHNVSEWSSDMSGRFYLSSRLSHLENSYFPIPEWFVPEIPNLYYHTNFKLGAGEYIYLSTSGTLVDQIEVPSDLRTEISKGRNSDGGSEWCYFDEPSPGTSNVNSWCFAGVAEAPELNLPSGWYEGEQSVSGLGGDDILRYTTNGDIPTESSLGLTTYSFDENTSLSVRAFSEDNLLPSPVVDYTYILEEDNHDLPVVSIHTNHDNLWDWNDGIYVLGPNANDAFPFFGSNFWQPWSKYSRLELFNGNKELIANEEMDLEIHGGWSRAFNQKSFRLDFKSIYSGDLEVPLFSQKPSINQFNNINIRSGGNRLYDDKIMDGLMSRLCHSLHIDVLAYEPCLVYLNGEFWGVYGIREKADEHYLESNHLVDNNEVDLLNSFSTLNGSEEHFIETFSLILNEPVDSEFFYELVTSRIDLENYIDYFIVQTYMQNKDWMGIAWIPNNIKLWRNQDDGRWRYILYDMDASFGFFEGYYSEVSDNYIDYARNPEYVSEHSLLFNRLLLNDQIKCEFTTRYADLMNTIFHPDRFEEEVSDVVNELQEAIPLQADRWTSSLSLEEWLIATDDIAQINESRQPYAREHVNSSLELEGQVELTFTVVPEEAGEIRINTIIPESCPWTGMYFNGCPVEISATSNPGYEFEYWEPNEILAVINCNENLVLNPSNNAVFTANFSREGIKFTEGISVFPNPSGDVFNVKIESVHMEDIYLNVYNQLGECVWHQKVEKQNYKEVIDVNLEGVSNGVYELRVSSLRGSVTRKLIRL